MIYLLRVPTSTVIGTSMVLTLVTMVFATMLHAVTNHLVDAVLALILMVGGVTGAQFGARAGQKIRGEHLRLLLGLLVLAVGIRFAIELVIRPDDLFTIRETGGARMIARASLAIGWPCAGCSCSPRRPARAERLIVSVSNHRVTVTPNYSGEELVLFGSVEKDATTPASRTSYDLVVTVSGPRADMVTRRKERKFGIWINTDSRQFLQSADLSGAVLQPAVRRHRLARSAAAAAARPQQRAADPARRPRLCRRGAERCVPQRLRAAALASTASIARRPRR